jgi:hypothetical protein
MLDSLTGKSNVGPATRGLWNETLQYLGVRAKGHDNIRGNNMSGATVCGHIAAIGGWAEGGVMGHRYMVERRKTSGFRYEEVERV